MNENKPFIDVEFFQGDLRITDSSLIDTGADITCITKDIAEKLKLHDSPYTVRKVIGFAGDTMELRQYEVNIQIEGRVFRNHPVIVADLPNPLIGWDILSEGTILSSVSSRVFSEVIHLLGSIGSFKKATVLVLGQDTTELHRLKTIQQRLRELGYTGIIVKDVADIEIQSIEEKVNMLASLTRFIICENSVASGHIDELKICASNRFVTAILQQEGMGATWMQADYPLDYSFMKTFKYSNLAGIKSAIDASVEWAETKQEERRNFLNALYHWR